ncbi:MAG: HD domain-containing protein [Candidatus Melainabacteria bacterium]|nr:HD domain-containing protein [Candidatus Melainabacteria bacterium]
MHSSLTIKELSHSLFIDLVETLLEPKTNKLWLQKVVNLLKQLLDARHVVLHAYIDNLIVFGSDDSSFINGKLQKQNYEIDQSYIFPLSVEGKIEVVWESKPQEDKLNEVNRIFLLVQSALKNRADLISNKERFLRQESLARIEKILITELDFKSQLYSFAKEVTKTLNTTRCQIKLFSQNKPSIFDNQLSTEYVQNGFLESSSIIPVFEKDWLCKLEKKYDHESFLLSYKMDVGKALSGIEALLSIYSVLGYPLIYKDKPIGVIVLHQCDYERNWKDDEISYLKEISLFLSVLIGKELDINKKKYFKDTLDLSTNIISSDEFLRELNHIQIEAQITNSFFSLIMVDIERLRDINLSLGFVAGNLVLSQTARYLHRIFSDKYQIVRFSNDEFIIIMKNVNEEQARLEAEKLKESLNNISVLGVGPVDYNFSFVTYPTHTTSISEMLVLLEQAMVLSKARGKLQISSFDEVKSESRDKWQQLIANAIPEIIIKKTSFKTGPEVIETINKQITENKSLNSYNADILDSVQSLAIALDAKDSYTKDHSKEVSEYAYLLAKNLNLDFQELEWIRLAASLHDIGKIGIPESILCKPGKLTKEEYEIIKKHPVIGAKILKPIKPLKKVAALVLLHHENWDGNGYPNHLKKSEIPLGARIVSIVDAYQAMTSDRPYRAALPFYEVIKRLKEGKGKQWDPELIDMFIEIITKQN